MLARLCTALAAALLVCSALAVPSKTIDEVIAHAEKLKFGRLQGVDATYANGRWAWEVYSVQTSRVVERRLDGASLRQVRMERLSLNPLVSKLSIRQALRSVRKSVRGVVLSLELERSDEFGIVWSAIVRRANDRVEVYIDGTSGRLLETEVEGSVGN
jgi:uncharacterized membrane protein YkoI